MVEPEGWAIAVLQSFDRDYKRGGVQALQRSQRRLGLKLQRRFDGASRESQVQVVPYFHM